MEAATYAQSTRNNWTGISLNSAGEGYTQQDDKLVDTGAPNQVILEGQIKGQTPSLLLQHFKRGCNVHDVPQI